MEWHTGKKFNVHPIFMIGIYALRHLSSLFFTFIVGATPEIRVCLWLLPLVVALVRSVKQLADLRRIACHLLCHIVDIYWLKIQTIALGNRRKSFQTINPNAKGFTFEHVNYAVYFLLQTRNPILCARHITECLSLVVILYALILFAPEEWHETGN